jgi:hypothetical protein
MDRIYRISRGFSGIFLQKSNQSGNNPIQPAKYFSVPEPGFSAFKREPIGREAIEKRVNPT